MASRKRAKALLKQGRVFGAFPIAEASCPASKRGDPGPSPAGRSKAIAEGAGPHDESYQGAGAVAKHQSQAPALRLFALPAVGAADDTR